MSNRFLLTLDRISFPDAVASELARARKLHPGKQHSIHEGYAILLEEVRELEKRCFEKRVQPIELAEELIQIGAMAQRFYEDVMKAKIVRDPPVICDPRHLANHNNPQPMDGHNA